MAECELCGKTANLMPALVEDTKFLVCPSCAQHGTKLVEDIPPKNPTINKPIKREQQWSIFIEGFNLKVKNAREKLNLTQEDLAKKLNEKLSSIHKLESGHFTPPISLARKLENFLNITLVQEIKEDYKEKKIDFKGLGLTIGDLIKLKKK